ncbi:MAG: patatin-like phospholipase family protein [Actinobacteria bacterium]|nr:patatin-like phospholipase family protein [Actinomycetota bacterium]
MIDVLSRNPLFAGLDPSALADLEAAMRRKDFAAGDVICREGEAGESLFLIVDGFARVLREGRPVARLRRGDVIGEMSLVSGEPRSATVVAAVPTTALELSRSGVAAVIAEQPRILGNLTRILSDRLAATTARVGDTRVRGEAVALLVSDAAASAVPDVISATEASSPRPVALVDVRDSPQGLETLDDLLAKNGTVVIVAGPCSAAAEEAADRTMTLDAPPADVARLGRHIARTKLGLALGAGGAKGYAHVGALRVLEEAGYTVDYVSGSSIGAMVGAWIALGRDSHEIEATMREAFASDTIDEIFKLSLTGGSTGLEAMTRLLRETTSDKTFDDLLVPFVAMTVDLNAQAPAPITEGTLWEALLAATALAGMFPPQEQDGKRLVDGLALVPVPTDAVAEAGADVTVAVNILSRQTLDAWPGEVPPAEPTRGLRSRMLDTLLEVMDVAQLDSSERHAARADVPITPRFGPSSWRDFHLADLFFEAGRKAAEEQLPALQALARPTPKEVLHGRS